MKYIGSVHWPGGLFGRTDELATIGAVLERLGTADSAAIEIVGEPGTGKSALLKAALAAATARRSTVVRIGSSLAEQHASWSALGALVEQVPQTIVGALSDEQRLALDVALGRRLGKVADIAPAVSAVVRDVLSAMCAESAVVVGIDDVHWIDAESATAFAVALRTMRTAPLAIICTSRRVATPIDLAHLFGDRLTVVEPSVLGRSDVQQILRSHGVTVTSAMLDDVDTLVAGNPMHARLLAEQISRDGWRPGRLPVSLSVGYAEVLDALAPDTIETLRLAALVGSNDLDLLGRCRPGIDIESALIEGERAGLLERRIDARGAHDDFGRVRPAVGAALLEGLGPVERRRMHQIVADALADDDDRWAMHLGAAQIQPDAGVAAALDAAALASLTRGARHAAGQLFMRSVELTPVADNSDRWRRTLAGADAFFGAGEFDLAETMSMAAMDGAVDPMQLALAGGVRTQVLAARGDLVDTHSFVVDLLQRLEGWPMLQGLLGRARVRIEQILDLHAALDTAEELRDLMASSGLHDLATEFEVAVANCHFVLGDAVEVAKIWDLARPVVNPADFIGAGWMALEMLVWGCHDSGLVDLALDQFEAAAEAGGASQSLAKVYDYRGNHLVRLGDWAGAEREMRKAVDAAILSQLTGSMADAGLAWLLAATGRAEEAANALATSSSATATDDTLLIKVSHLAAEGFIEFCAGRWETAVETLVAAWSAADKLGLRDLCALPFRVDLVESLIRCGRVGEADERSVHIRALAERSGRSVAMIQAERADTLVCAARGDVDGAIRAADRALAHHRQVELPFELARLQLALGSAYRRAGRRNDAETALVDALTIFDSLGALPFGLRTQEELTRLGGRRAVNELTATEEQVARLVASGKTNAEVAAELIVSLRTVESNLTRIYRKLGLRSRSELAATMRDAD